MPRRSDLDQGRPPRSGELTRTLDAAERIVGGGEQNRGEIQPLHRHRPEAEAVGGPGFTQLSGKPFRIVEIGRGDEKGAGDVIIGLEYDYVALSLNSGGSCPLCDAGLTVDSTPAAVTGTATISAVMLRASYLFMPED
jgi:hypothetical protein